MQSRGALLAGLGAGAALFYFLDPNSGGRRRALVRDKLTRGANITSDAVETFGRDFANRAAGSAAVFRRYRETDSVDDHVIVERARSVLGRVVSHPRAIDIDSHNGEVTLTGPILTGEAQDLIHAISAVRGVRYVVNNLQEYDSAENVPALQGGTRRPGLQSDIMQRRWSPTTRFATGFASALLMAGLLRRASGFEHAGGR